MTKNLPIVVNEKDYRDVNDGSLLPIGRSTRYGNYPVYQQRLATRKDAVLAFIPYLADKMRSGSFSLADIERLGGRKLACYCKPKLCHGDILVILYDVLYDATAFDSKKWLANKEAILSKYTEIATAHVLNFEAPVAGTAATTSDQLSLF